MKLKGKVKAYGVVRTADGRIKLGPNFKNWPEEQKQIVYRLLEEERKNGRAT